MKNSLHITAIIDHPGFLEDIIEKLAMRHNTESSQFDNSAIETSSTETYVSGTMVIENSKEHFDMPFIAPFLFTCIKRSEDTYSLEWGLSLS